MYFEEICIFFRQLIFLIQYYKPKVKRLIQLWWSLIDVKPAPIFSFFENKIISVHISIVSGCDPWGWIRLLLICCFAFCFGWVLSLFTPHQVWHLMELCELIQHTLTRQCSERQKWGVLLSEVTVIIQVVRITVLPREKEKLWKWREPGVRCPVAVISWLSQWSWWIFVLRYCLFFVFGRDCWTSIWQYPMAALLLLSVWVTHLASAGIQKNWALSAWSYRELWVSVLLCICSNLTDELCSSNQWLEQFGGRSEWCLCRSGECRRSLSMKHLNRKSLSYSHICHIAGWKRFCHVCFSFNHRPYVQKC